ncbi:MAG: hypothetical protein ACTHMU_06670 [Thermomicrobiales bacterium]
MTGQMHAMVGLAVLIVNLIFGVWALIVARRGGAVSGLLTGGIIAGLALLLLQILAGFDLLGRGLRPAGAGLTIGHAGGPIVALIVAAALLLRPGNRAARYATTALFTVLIALISYGIGEMG